VFVNKKVQRLSTKKYSTPPDTETDDIVFMNRAIAQDFG